MKKYFVIAAAAALALASCAKVETYTESLNDGQQAIGFSNYSPKTLSRADGTLIVDNKLANGKKFGVYAYSTTNGNAWKSDLTATGNALFMNGVSVTYTTGGDTDATKNTYAPVRYWPAGDTPDWLTFWAYYPVEETSGKVTAGSNGITYTAPNGSNGLGSYAFTANSTAATMVDFIVSDVVNDKIYGTATGEHIAVNGVVPLVFRHMLTKVQVKFKTSDEVDDDANTQVFLTDAKFVDVKTTGTLTAVYNKDAVAPTPNVTTSWGNSQGTPANYEIFVNTKDVNDGANKVELHKTVTTVDPSEIFLMVPQTMIAKTGSNPQILRVNWDVVTDGVTTSNTADLYLDECVQDDGTTQANIDWVKNHSVTYTLTIGPKPIRFTANVAGWETEDAGYFNVQ